MPIKQKEQSFYEEKALITGLTGQLGAPSQVAVSFYSPEYITDVDAMGTLRLLEAIHFLGLEKN